jgi:hypothetical protein
LCSYQLREQILHFACNFLLGKTPFVFTVSTIEPQLSQEIIPLAISTKILPPKWHSGDADKLSHFPFLQKLSPKWYSSDANKM